MNIRLWLYCGVLAVCVCSVVDSHAQGVDSWTRLAEAQGLFSPHTNYCDSSTEVFLSIGGGDLGFCMEKTTRATAAWEVAKQECAEDGKRLPEPAEFKYACKNPPGGLADMTEAPEWISNFSTAGDVYSGTATELSGAWAPIGGINYCTKASWGWIMGNGATGFEDSYVYRCVR